MILRYPIIRHVRWALASAHLWWRDYLLVHWRMGRFYSAADLERLDRIWRGQA